MIPSVTTTASRGAYSRDSIIDQTLADIHLHYKTVLDSLQSLLVINDSLNEDARRLRAQLELNDQKIGELRDRFRYVDISCYSDFQGMERIFRARIGRTVKDYADEQKKEELIQLLAGGFRYGYEIGGALGFKTDQSFYHWVGLVFGVTFRKLRSVLRQETTYSGRARM